ncbi:MAG: hypothetical protein Q8876_08180 [Bacillota bacterium]|nr:hypothetical protein [Bacillota bacterium]
MNTCTLKTQKIKRFPGASIDNESPGPYHGIVKVLVGCSNATNINPMNRRGGRAIEILTG